MWMAPTRSLINRHRDAGVPKIGIPTRAVGSINLLTASGCLNDVTHLYLFDMTWARSCELIFGFEATLALPGRQLSHGGQR